MTMTEYYGGTCRASYHTLGCKLNFAETSAIESMLSAAGWVRAREGEDPDLCVINTCSVTETADKKCRQLIARLHRLHPGARIIVTGCYAQLKPETIAAMPGVSAVLGQDRKGSIADIATRLMQKPETEAAVQVDESRALREFVPACGHGERTRYWLKVQDGCDYWCSYCTIPMARGRSRSATVEQCVDLAAKAAAAGAREIVLTGVNVGEFGRDHGQDFISLIRALDRVEGIARYRISSIEPNLLTPGIIEFVAGSRAFMPHFHVPLQSGSDAVLTLMRRRYDTALFASRMELIRSTIPDAFIGVDIIAGARGESEREWLRSVDFIRSLPVQQLHVFPYSERPGTRALELEGEVPVSERHRRVGELIELSRSKYDAFRHSQLGRTHTVLWEHPDAGATMMHGFTGNYLRVETPADLSLAGTLTPVRLTSVTGLETMACEILHHT